MSYQNVPHYRIGHLKMLKMANFMSCVLYHYLKKFLPMIYNRASFTELLVVENLMII